MLRPIFKSLLILNKCVSCICLNSVFVFYFQYFPTVHNNILYNGFFKISVKFAWRQALQFKNNSSDSLRATYASQRYTVGLLSLSSLYSVKRKWFNLIFHQVASSQEALWKSGVWKNITTFTKWWHEQHMVFIFVCVWVHVWKTMVIAQVYFPLWHNLKKKSHGLC